jgi:hypothetical protein
VGLDEALARGRGSRFFVMREWEEIAEWPAAVLQPSLPQRSRRGRSTPVPVEVPPRTSGGQGWGPQKAPELTGLGEQFATTRPQLRLVHAPAVVAAHIALHGEHPVVDRR